MTNPNYRIIWLVRRLFRALAEESTNNLREFGITAADRAVMEFLYPDSPLSVPEIAARYQVSRQHVQTTVNPLLDGGLLTSLPNPRHKRSPLIGLTAEGRRLFKRILVSDLSAVDTLFEGIPARDRQATTRTLETILNRLKEQKP